MAAAGALGAKAWWEWARKPSAGPEQAEQASLYQSAQVSDA